MNWIMVASVAVSGTLAVVFVWLNTWALQMQLEETFVSLAMFYGMLTVVVNALFVGLATPRRAPARDNNHRS